MTTNGHLPLPRHHHLDVLFENVKVNSAPQVLLRVILTAYRVAAQQTPGLFYQAISRSPVMAQCSQCNKETELYDRGVPLCPSCDPPQTSKTPTKQVTGDARTFPLIAANTEAGIKF